MKNESEKNENNKSAFEKKLLAEMMGLYCRKLHQTKDSLCPGCADLLAYAQTRSDRCPYAQTKTFLLAMRRTLRYAEHARAHSRSDAFFRPADAAAPSGNDDSSPDVAATQENGGAGMNIKKMICLIIGCIGRGGSADARLSVSDAGHHLLCEKFKKTQQLVCRHEAL